MASKDYAQGLGVDIGTLMSRRRILRILGVGAATAGLAACASNAGGSSSTTSSTTAAATSAPASATPAAPPRASR